VRNVSVQNAEKVRD